MRAHIVIPRDLVEEVDALVGRRRRSQFLTEAVREKLMHERRRTVATEVAGSLADVLIPEWNSSDETAAWVRSLRQSADWREDWTTDSSRDGRVSLFLRHGRSTSLPLGTVRRRGSVRRRRVPPAV